MSPAARKKKTARKGAAKKTRVVAKKAAKKAATKRTAAKTSAARKPAARKAAKKSVKVKTVAKKSAAPAKKTVAKTPARSVATQAPPAKPAVSRPAPAPAAAPRTEARTPPRNEGHARRRPASSPTRPSHHDGASPDVARQHFRELLEAKQARVRQGPSYPPANAHTGQHPAAPVPLPAYVAVPTESRAAEPGSDTEPEHARGNQGMREQK